MESLRAKYEQRLFDHLNIFDASDRLKACFPSSARSIGLDALDALEFLERSRRKTSNGLDHVSKEEAKLQAKYLRLRSYLAWWIIHDNLNNNGSKLRLNILVETMFPADEDVSLAQRAESLEVLEDQYPLSALREKLQEREVVAKSIDKYCAESLALINPMDYNRTSPLPPIEDIEQSTQLPLSLDHSEQRSTLAPTTSLAGNATGNRFVRRVKSWITRPQESFMGLEVASLRGKLI